MPSRRSATLGWSLSFLGVSIAAWLGNRSILAPAWVAALLAWQLVFALRRSARASTRCKAHLASEHAATVFPLRAGPCVLEGTVAYAHGASEAMRMEFLQVGDESESSGSWSHRWNEISRKLTVQPFYLVRGDGQRVRVEPKPDQSQLFDELESKILVESAPPDATPRRLRLATLMPNERIWITGRLERGFDPEQSGLAAGSGYRESAAPESWVLRGAPTLLVSSVSLAAHFRRRAGQHVRHAVLYAVCLLAPAVSIARYLDRAEGETVRLTTDESVLVLAFGAAVLVLRCMLTLLAIRSLPWFRSPKGAVNDSGSGRLPGRG